MDWTRLHQRIIGPCSGGIATDLTRRDRTYLIATFLLATTVTFLTGRIQPTVARQSDWSILASLAPTILALVALLAIAVWTLLQSPIRDSLKAWIGLVLVMMLLAIPMIIERTPRFNYVFVILHEHSLLVEDGLRAASIRDHNWPAVFYLTEALVLSAGVSPVGIALFTPLVGHTALFLIVTCLAKKVGRPAVHAVAIGLLAVLLNWVGQDYLSLQHLGLLLYATATLLLVDIYREGTTAPRAAALLVLAVGTVFSHLLSALLLVLLSLAIATLQSRSIRKHTVPLAAIITIFLAWNVFISTFFIRVGQGPLGNILGLRFLFLFRETFQDTAQLAVAPSPVHNILAAVKIGTVALVLLLAALGGWWAWRDEKERRALGLIVLLVAVASVSILLGPYGGEILFRVYMFSIPPLALLIGYLYLKPSGRKAFTFLIPILAVLFIVNHYANEVVDVTPESELVSAATVDRHLPEGVEVFSPGNHVIGIYREYETIRPKEVQAVFMTERPALVKHFLGEKTHARADTTLPTNVLYGTVYDAGPNELLLPQG